MAQASIDSLATKRSLIDLEGHSDGDFGLGDEFLLSFVFDDIILVEFIDESSEEGAVMQLREVVYLYLQML